MGRLRSPLLGSAFALPLLLPQTSFSAPCVDYSQYLHIHGSLPIDEFDFSSVRDLELVDDLLFMAAASSYGSAVSWIEVADVSDPENPALLDPTPVPGVITGMQIVGNHAFVVGDSGMTVLDVSNPSDFPIVGEMNIPFGARDFEIVGDIAYIANPPGLVVADISNPLQPHILGSRSLGTSTMQVEVLEPYAYLGTTFDFRIVDVSNPNNPVQVGTYPDLGGAMEIRGTRLYMGDYPALKILDLTNPILPQLIQEIPTSLSYIFAIDIADDKLHVAGNQLEIFDISSLEEPERFGTIEVCGSASILVDGEYAFSGCAIGLQVIDVSNPANVPILGSLDIPNYSPSIKMGSGVVYVGNAENTGTGYGALHVVDVSDPSNPVLLGTLSTWEVRGIAIAGNHAALACGASGLRVASVLDPTNPVIVGARNTPGTAEDVEVTSLGTHAVIDDGGSSIVIMTIANPTNPQIVSSFALAGSCSDFGISGDLFIGATTGLGTNAFQVVDIAVPANPVPVGYLDFGSFQARSVAVSGSLAYVTGDGEMGHTLNVIDSSDPSVPEIIASIPILIGGGSGTRSSLVGQTLYLFTTDGLQTIDVSNPLAPRLIGHTHYVDASNIAANSEIVCLSLREGGLVIFPPQCESGPVSVSELPLLSQTALGSVYPNPFHQAASVRFTLANACQARLTVHDVAGRLVRDVAKQEFGEGLHTVVWDGQDEHALPVSPGVYFVRLETPDHQEARRVVRLR
jgi:hypothetical protein